MSLILLIATLGGSSTGGTQSKSNAITFNGVAVTFNNQPVTHN